MRWFALLIALPACVSPAFPRSPRIAPAGAVGWELQLPLVEGGPGRIEGQVEGVPISSETTSLGVFDGGAVPVIPYWWETSARVGLGGGCELGPILSLSLRLAPELRCGAAHGSLAAALSGASGFAFGFGRAGPWWRAGLDIGWRNTGGEALAGVYVTRGVESHRLQLGPAASEALVIDLPENISYDGESIPAPQVAREETRLAVPLGWALEGEVRFVFGVVPYWILDAGAGRLARCAGCRPFVLVGYEQSWGVAVTVGVQR